MNPANNPKFVRVYPSALDGWDYFQFRDERDDRLERYIADITRQTPPNAQMERGTKFHEALEKYMMGGEWDCDIEFDSRLDVRLLRPSEVEVKRQTIINSDRYIFSGRADALVAGRKTIIDYKTTQRGIDLTKYADSWQWRAYFMIFTEYDRFRFDAFQLRNNGVWHVADHNYIQLQPYPGMEKEVHSKALEWVEFVRELDATGRLIIDEDGRLKPINGEDKDNAGKP